MLVWFVFRHSTFVVNDILVQAENLSATININQLTKVCLHFNYKKDMTNWDKKNKIKCILTNCAVSTLCGVRCGGPLLFAQRFPPGRAWLTRPPYTNYIQTSISYVPLTCLSISFYSNLVSWDRKRFIK